MRSDSPPDSWYQPEDEVDPEDEHACRGVWCLHRSHRTDD
jgi:hypothetical protein